VSPGDILAGKYRVEQVLGVGGMGVVVAATHVDLRERRAIKFMLPVHLDNREAVERFLREARASSRLKGEHVAKVHDVGRLENGAPYLVMEYLTGRDLRHRLQQRGALAVTDVALYLLHVCEALAEAHGAGIVHRDLKPENLFLTKRPDGTPTIKVLDFGISKMSGAGGDLAVTSTQAIMGSPHYMSPEQLRSSRDVDARTDIWALGVILYQLLTNNLPFEGENLTAVIASVIFGKFTPPTTLKSELPPALDAIIARCLERDLERRYPSVAALATDLLPFAPAAAGPALARIVRLLQPSRAPSSEGAPPSSSDAPVSSDPAAPVWSEPAPTAPVSPGGSPDGSSAQPADPLATLASNGPRTLRSQTPVTPVPAVAAVSNGAWGAGGPSRALAGPRAPVRFTLGVAVALGVAIAAVLGGAAILLFDRGPTGVDAGLPTATARAATTTVASAEAPPVVAPASAAPITVAPAATLAPSPSVPSAGSSAHAPRPGASGKWPSRPTATGGPSTPPPPPGDPFGAGRQ
jgi:serine/threonine-protein kinase